MNHWINMISQNVQVILAVDPTMQGNDWTERILRYRPKTSLIQLRVSLREEGSQGYICFPWLSPNINSPSLGKREKLDSPENITCFHWSATSCDLYITWTYCECRLWKEEVSWWRLLHNIRIIGLKANSFLSKLDY